MSFVVLWSPKIFLVGFGPICWFKRCAFETTPELADTQINSLSRTCQCSLSESRRRGDTADADASVALAHSQRSLKPSAAAFQVNSESEADEAEQSSLPEAGPRRPGAGRLAMRSGRDSNAANCIGPWPEAAAARRRRRPPLPAERPAQAHRDRRYWQRQFQNSAARRCHWPHRARASISTGRRRRPPAGLKGKAVCPLADDPRRPGAAVLSRPLNKARSQIEVGVTSHAASSSWHCQAESESGFGHSRWTLGIGHIEHPT